MARAGDGVWKHVGVLGPLLPMLVLGMGCADGGADPMSLDELPRIGLVEELRIGSMDDPDLGFSDLRAPIEVTEGDTIYAVEHDVPEIRVYSPEGGLVRRIGRRGDGPGEFEGMISGWGVRGDTVWVVEFTRVTLFRRDGAVILANRVEPVTIDADPYRIMLAPSTMRADGTIVSDRILIALTVGDLPEREVRVPILARRMDGEALDTIGYRTMTLGEGDRPSRTVGSYPIPIYQTDYPSADSLEHAEEEDTIRIRRPVAESGTEGMLTVVRVSGGDTIVHRKLRYRPVSLPGTYGDSVIDHQVEQRGSTFGAPEAVREAMEEMYRFAAFYPPVSELRVTDDGSIWLLRQPGSEDGWHWIVLDGEGLPKGEVVTPPQSDILWSDGEVLFTSEENALNVPWLVRYRMGSPD